MGTGKKAATDRSALSTVRRQQVLHQVRQAVWQMRSSADLRQVLAAVRAGLEELQVPFEVCELNCLDVRYTPPRLRSHTLEATHDWEYVDQDAGVCILLRIWESGKSAYRPDLAAEDLNHERELIAAFWNSQVRAVLDVPFSHGTLALNSSQPHAFSADHIALVEEMAQILSEGWSRFEDLEALEHRVQQAEALAASIAAVASSRSLDEMLQVIADEASRVMHCPRARVMLHDPQSGMLVVWAAVGFDRDKVRQVQIPLGAGLAGHVFATGQPYLLNRLNHDALPSLPPLVAAALEAASLDPVLDNHCRGAGVPLRADGQVIGVIVVGGHGEPLLKSDVELLRRLGDQASLAVERARHLDALNREVAERQQAEADLRTSEQRLHQAQDIAHLGIWDWDIATDQTVWWGEMFNLYGIRPEEFTGRGQDYISFTHPDDRPTQVRNIEQALEEAARSAGPTSCKSGPNQFRLVRPDGSLCWVEGSAVVEVGPEGQPLRMLGVLVDITDRKQKEEEARIDLALEQVRNAVLQMKEAQDWIKVVNVLSRELAGLVELYLPSVQIVDLAAETFTVYNALQEEGKGFLLTDSLRQVMQEGRPLYRRNRCEITQRGDRLPESINSVLDVPFTGGTIAINSTRENAFGNREIRILERFAQAMGEGYQRQEDLKRLSRTEERLRQAQKLEAVGQLTAGVAHNFNNLLQAVVANLTMAMMKGPEVVQPWLQEAEKAAMRGADLVRQLMLYTREKTGVFTFQPVAMSRVVEDALSLCRKTFDRRLELQAELDAELPLVSGDASQLQQVLLNLYMNARDALAEVEGRQPVIRTTARRVEQVAPGKQEKQAYVQVQVCDNGTGMDPQTREHIFEPFFTTKEVGKGTGLGLATVYGILERHQGWIECESEVGVGTTLSVYLPLASAAATETKTEAPGQVRGGVETLLLIDDEVPVRQSVARLFTDLGYRVLEAEDGQRGLELAGLHRADLVLLDWSMPGLSGREVLRRLQTLDPQLKVMIFSGYAPDHRECEGVVAVVEKPFSIRHLASTVRWVLDHPGSH
ncbi:MAG: GAF domain-containing protein [Candidatus Latescibacteria bacterium]|nr:GAF domain-containing protein [Candidatus Latescibacterota bacterium]